MKKIVQIITMLGITQFGFSQTALNFDGINDYVQTYYQGVTGNGNRTFEAWVYVDTPASSSNLAILDYGSNVAGGRNTFCVKGDKSLAFISGGTTNANISSSANTVPIGQWTHVAFVLNFGTGYLYVNGIQVGTGPLSSVSTPFTGERVKIGERVTGGSIPFKGSIDEVRIWDLARSSTQILANKDAEYCQIQSWRLDAYYRFNEGIAGGTNFSDTIVIDYARIFNGTLHGFSLTGSSSNFVTGPILTPGYSRTLFKDSVCSSFTTVSGKNFTVSGFYFDTLKNAMFCDSLVEYDLTIINLDDSIYKLGNKLVSNDTRSQYQWVDCNNGFSPILGETNKDYTPTITGQYAVVVSKGRCSDTSNCVKVNFTDLKEISLNLISLYPNPANETLFIKSNLPLTGTKVGIYSINGRLVDQFAINNSSLDISKLSSGIYYIRINTNFGSSNLKFIKQ
jgi:hypothetical protein